jgi:hypothetical protein
MNKYNIFSIFFRFGFGHISILMWFLGMTFHNLYKCMQPTLLLLLWKQVLNACVLAQMY